MLTTCAIRQIYGGIGMGVMVMCVLTLIATSNVRRLLPDFAHSAKWFRQYMFGLSRILFFMWPAILLTVAVRATVMMFQLNYHQDHIMWVDGM